MNYNNLKNNDVMLSDIHHHKKSSSLIPGLPSNGLVRVPPPHGSNNSNISNNNNNNNNSSNHFPPFNRGDSLASQGDLDDVLTAADDRVTFNIGGVIFQTTQSTCRKRPTKRFKLADADFLEQHYDAKRMEYFFDRDPEVFRSILNFWRTGSLHLPLTVCGPHIKDELDYWGLRELDIQPCCWDSYNMWMKTVESLYKLERDRQPAYLRQKEEEFNQGSQPKTKWQRGSLVVWNFLTDPSYSKSAKVYAYVSLFFVILAIFSFCASTHKAFRFDDERDRGDDGGKPNDTSINKNASSADYPSDVSSSTLPTATGTTMRPRGKDIITDSNVHPALFYIDVVCLAFFTLEYLTRLVCASTRCRFLISFSSIVDLLAILPDYVEFLVYSLHADTQPANSLVQFMPFLRLMRALRIFRLVRRVPGLWIMLYTLKASFKELSLMLVFLLVGTLFFSSVIYFVDDPHVFKSIPHGFWWAIVTMTTVGYGDVAPTTAWGKLVGSTTAICGVLLVGFTIPALVNNFITYYQHVEFVYKKERLMAESALSDESEGETGDSCAPGNEDKDKDDDDDDDDDEGGSRYRLRSTDAMLPECSSSHSRIVDV